MEGDSGSADMGGGAEAAEFADAFGGELGGIALEVAGVTLEVESVFVTDSSIDIALFYEAGIDSTEPSPDAIGTQLINTINEIGAKVFAEIGEDKGSEALFAPVVDELAEQNEDLLSTDIPSASTEDEALLYAAETSPPTAAEETDETEPLYVPIEWAVGPENAESDQPSDYGEEVQSAEATPDIDSEAAYSWQTDPVVASIMETIGDELLPESDEFDPTADKPAQRTLYVAEAAASKQASSGQGVFEALIGQRGMSLDNVSTLTREGRADGLDFVDEVQYTETSTGLTLLVNTRTYPDSGKRTVEVVATRSLEEYLHRDLEPKQDILQVTWSQAGQEYDLSWQSNSKGPDIFPEDIEVALHGTLVKPWKAEDARADTMPVTPNVPDPEILKQGDVYVLNGVHQAVDAARQHGAKPRITGP